MGQGSKDHQTWKINHSFKKFGCQKGVAKVHPSKWTKGQVHELEHPLPVQIL